MLEILKDARTMKRLMEKTLDRRINPFNVAPKGPRQDQHGREHPGRQPSHFELSAFEQILPSGSRERSQDRHRVEGTFAGQHGEIQPPRLNISYSPGDVDTA